MSGIASAAIIGGAALAGSVGSGLLAKGAASGASGASGVAAQQSLAASTHQIDVNRADASPWTATGGAGIQQLGALLGYGSLYGNGTEGNTLQYGSDPNAYANALAQLRQYAGASGATLPTYNAYSPMTTVSDTFTADPSYAFRVSEGTKALDRSAASKGMLLSGAQGKALTDYGQNTASEEYANWFQRYNAQQQFNLGVNNQNFGQQQTLYQDQYGQWRDALGDVSKVAGLGESANAGVAGADTSLTNSAGNALTGGAAASGAFDVAGANAAASGIGAGVNNALTAYLLRNKFSGSGGGSSIYTGSPGGGPNGQ